MKNLKKIFVMLVVCAPLHFASAQSAHPIDNEILQCYSESPGTAGMVECDAIAYKKWETEMNRLYNLLLALVGNEEQALLKNQQIKWKELHDAEVVLIKALYSDQPSVLSSSVTDIVRKRAFTLQSYIDLLEENK